MLLILYCGFYVLTVKRAWNGQKNLPNARFRLTKLFVRIQMRYELSSAAVRPRAPTLTLTLTLTRFAFARSLVRQVRPAALLRDRVLRVDRRARDHRDVSRGH